MMKSNFPFLGTYLTLLSGIFALSSACDSFNKRKDLEQKSVACVESVDTNCNEPAGRNTIFNPNGTVTPSPTPITPITPVSNEPVITPTVPSVSPEVTTPIIVENPETPPNPITQVPGGDINHLGNSVLPNTDGTNPNGTPQVVIDFSSFLDLCAKRSHLEPKVASSIDQILQTMRASTCENAASRLTNLHTLIIGDRKHHGFYDGILAISNATGFSDLAFLKSLKNLQTIRLIGVPAEDLSPLSHQSSLRSLTLESMDELKSLDDLTELSTLQELRLKSLNIGYFAPLASLQNLKILEISGSELQDVTFIESLISLEELILDQNKIRTATALAALVSLKKLNLVNNLLSDISFVRSLGNLSELHISQNQIQDVRYLSELSSLEVGYLDSNRIIHVPNLSSLSKLRQLRLDENAGIINLSSVQQPDQCDKAGIGLRVTAAPIDTLCYRCDGSLWQQVDSARCDDELFNMCVDSNRYFDQAIGCRVCSGGQWTMAESLTACGIVVESISDLRPMFRLHQSEPVNPINAAITFELNITETLYDRVDAERSQFVLSRNNIPIAITKWSDLSYESGKIQGGFNTIDALGFAETYEVQLSVFDEKESLVLTAKNALNNTKSSISTLACPEYMKLDPVLSTCSMRSNYPLVSFDQHIAVSNIMPNFSESYLSFKDYPNVYRKLKVFDGTSKIVHEQSLDLNSQILASPFLFRSGHLYRFVIDYTILEGRGQSHSFSILPSESSSGTDRNYLFDKQNAFNVTQMAMLTQGVLYTFIFNGNVCLYDYDYLGYFDSFLMRKTCGLTSSQFSEIPFIVERTGKMHRFYQNVLGTYKSAPPLEKKYLSHYDFELVKIDGYSYVTNHINAFFRPVPDLPNTYVLVKAISDSQPGFMCGSLRPSGFGGQPCDLGDPNQHVVIMPIQ